VVSPDGFLKADQDNGGKIGTVGDSCWYDLLLKSERQRQARQSVSLYQAQLGGKSLTSRVCLYR
jgi:hypothetical protein